MAKRQRQWARRARLALLEQLGGVCAVCGTDKALEIDCKIPQGDKHHRFETDRRVSFYRKQHALGNLQLLCSKHHALKTAEEMDYHQLNFFESKLEYDNVPF